MDGDGEFSTISDNGTEDYIGGAWCFTDAIGIKPERAYNFPYPLTDDIASVAY
jgi:hypothetical protein